MLPLAELLVAAVVAGPRLVDDYQIGQLFRDPSWVRIMSHLNLDQSIQSRRASRRAWISRITDELPERTQLVALANIPGAAVDAVIVAARHRRTIEPSPTFSFDRWAWAAMLYPIFALPFWWVVGRSADAARTLRSASPKRLRWWDLVLVLPVAVGGIAAGIDYLAFATADDKASADFRAMMFALAVWGALCAGATVIWFLQRRKHRLLERSGLA